MNREFRPIVVAHVAEKIAYGTSLTCDKQGKLIKAMDTDYVIGLAMSDSTEDGLVSVRLNKVQLHSGGLFY